MMKDNRKFESYPTLPDIPPEDHIWVWTNFYCQESGGIADPDDQTEIESLQDTVGASTGLPVTQQQIKELLIERRTWQLAALETAKLRQPKAERPAG